MQRSSSQIKVFLQFLLVRGKVSKMSSPLMSFKLSLFTIFWKPSQIQTIANETWNYIIKCNFSMWTDFRADTLLPSCWAAQYKRLCNESIGAAWKGFVLSPITAHWSFFYLPLRLIDPLFKLKRLWVDPCVDCRRWVHISAFGRQPRILITFWLQVCASLRKRKVEKTLSGLTFQCPKHFCRLHTLYRHC